MIKVRLLKERGNQVYRLVDSVDLPSMESTEDLNGIALGLGKMLGKYQELINDKSILSALIDSSINDWTIRDIESLQALLSDNQMRLIISEEDQVDTPTKIGDVVYLMMDYSDKLFGIIPQSNYTVVVNNPQSIDILSIIKQLLLSDYFPKNKFLNNPINDLLNSLQESRDLIGAYNGYSLNKLYKLLDELNKELITIVID